MLSAPWLQCNASIILRIQFDTSRLFRFYDKFGAMKARSVLFDIVLTKRQGTFVTCNLRNVLGCSRLWLADHRSVDQSSKKAWVEFSALCSVRPGWVWHVPCTGHRVCGWQTIDQLISHQKRPGLNFPRFVLFVRGGSGTCHAGGSTRPSKFGTESLSPRSRRDTQPPVADGFGGNYHGKQQAMGYQIPRIEQMDESAESGTIFVNTRLPRKRGSCWCYYLQNQSSWTQSVVYSRNQSNFPTKDILHGPKQVHRRAGVRLTSNQPNNPSDQDFSRQLHFQNTWYMFLCLLALALNCACWRSAINESNTIDKA